MMSKWKFAKCGDGWWLVIDDLNQFFEYHERTDISYGIDFVMKGRSEGKTSRDKKIEEIANLRESSVFDAAISVCNGVFKAQLEALRRGENIYINRSGGWNNCMHPECFFLSGVLAWPPTELSERAPYLASMGCVGVDIWSDILKQTRGKIRYGH